MELHSLARDREALNSMRRFTITGHLGLDGSMVMRRSLPDEELFESLATRLRPVLLKSESIHYNKVLDAIEELVDAADVPVDAANPIRVGLGQLRNEWSRFDLDSENVLGFAVQSSTLDGSQVTPQVSDTQLAAAWLYGDLVHVDTKGKKTEGMLLPVKERFSAAVSYFAHVAVLVVSTLDMVRRLDELGVVELGAHALSDEVVVGAEELIDEATAYVGPMDAAMPALDMTLGDLPAEFRKFTVTGLLRQDPSNQVEVVLEDGQGDVVARYEAAVNRRRELGGRLFWSVLIEDVTEFEVSFAVKGDRLDDIRLEKVVSHASTNRMMLSDAVLQQLLSQSAKMSFVVAGQQFFSLGPPPVDDDERAFIDISIDTLTDLVRIEQIVDRALSPLEGSYTRAARASLRRARLLWEGKVVVYGSGPLNVTVLAGMIPEVIAVPEGSFAVGDVEVPFPQTYLRHPATVVTSTTAIPDSDPPAEQLVLAVPDGEVFVAWSAEKRQVSKDEDLSDPARWDLSHFDENEFLFGK